MPRQDLTSIAGMALQAALYLLCSDSELHDWVSLFWECARDPGIHPGNAVSGGFVLFTGRARAALARMTHQQQALLLARHPLLALQAATGQTSELALNELLALPPELHRFIVRQHAKQDAAEWGNPDARLLRLQLSGRVLEAQLCKRLAPVLLQMRQTQAASDAHPFRLWLVLARSTGRPHGLRAVLRRHVALIAQAVRGAPVVRVEAADLNLNPASEAVLMRVLGRLGGAAGDTHPEQCVLARQRQSCPASAQARARRRFSARSAEQLGVSTINWCHLRRLDAADSSQNIAHSKQ